MISPDELELLQAMYPEELQLRPPGALTFSDAALELELRLPATTGGAPALVSVRGAAAAAVGAVVAELYAGGGDDGDGDDGPPMLLHEVIQRAKELAELNEADAPPPPRSPDDIDPAEPPPGAPQEDLVRQLSVAMKTRAVGGKADGGSKQALQNADAVLRSEVRRPSCSFRPSHSRRRTHTGCSDPASRTLAAAQLKCPRRARRGAGAQAALGGGAGSARGGAASGRRC